MPMKLIVENLAPTVTSDDLRRLFSICGPVCGVSMALEPQTRRSLGKAEVEMVTAESGAESLRIFEGREFKGQKLHLKSQNTFVAKKPGARRIDVNCGGHAVIARRQDALQRLERLFHHP